MNPRQVTAQRARDFFMNELVKRGYKTQKECTRNEELPPSYFCVGSPLGKEFVIKVLGQSTKNFWRYDWKQPSRDLYYAFIFVPHDKDPRVFIMESQKAMELWDEYKERIMQTNKNEKNHWGINWTTPHPFEGSYDLLPG